MQVRDYKKSEVGEIREIIRKSLNSIVLDYYSPKVIYALYNFYDEAMINSCEDVMVSVDKEKINGCMAFSENEIKIFYIDPEFERRPYIPLMFLRYAKRKLKEKGYSIMKANILESAKYFWEKQKYVEFGNPYNDKIGDILFTRIPIKVRL